MYSTIEAGGPDGIESDLCIVGAGMAGLTVARALLETGLKICVIESGGFEPAADTPSLNAVDNDGPVSLELVDSRPRLFGGGSGLWGSLCCPFDDSDFAMRPELPLRTWPITLSDLDPFYREAQRILGLGPPEFDERLWNMFGAAPPSFDGARLRTRFWQMRSPGLFPLVVPLRFATAYRPMFERSADVRVLLNCTAVAVSTTAGRDHASHVELRGMDGRPGLVRGRAVLLAGGAIENARLLLASGFGGGESMLGRCFMDHPHVRIGTVATEDPVHLLDMLAVRRRRGGVALQPALCPTPAFQAAQDILNASVAVDVEPDKDCPTLAFSTIAHAVMRGGVPADLWPSVRRIAADPASLAGNLYRRIFRGTGALPRVGRVSLYCRSEQEPNPESRVVLDTARDRLGMRRARLDWRLSERDRRTVATVGQAIAAEFARLGLGRVAAADWLRERSGWPAEIRGGPHHSGTTRMAADPRLGVVDRDCRVFGTDNLYVTGASVFPTGGYANPALSVVALALRAAGHLKSQLATGRI